LLSSIADIGLDTIIDAMREASGPLLLLAFFIGLTPRFANAVALSAVAPSKIPLGRLTALQFAISYVNLAIPSSAARVALNIRFFQRFGVDPTTAASAGVIDKSRRSVIVEREDFKFTSVWVSPLLCRLGIVPLVSWTRVFAL
jgi:hypothetical protein